MREQAEVIGKKLDPSTQLAVDRTRGERLTGPTEFALLMIVIGLATLEHRRDLHALREQYPGVRRSLARVFAALISILGLVALISVLFRQ